MNDHRRPRGRPLIRRASALVGLTAIAVLAACIPGPTASAAIGPLLVLPTSGPPGTKVTVSGWGCSPGLVPSSSQDYVSVSSTTLPLNVHAPVYPGGTWSTSLTVPARTPAVPALIAATCFTDGLPSFTTLYTPATFTVTAATTPATAPPPPPPPATTGTAGTTPTTKSTSPTTTAGSSGGGTSSDTGSGGSASATSGNGPARGSRAGGGSNGEAALARTSGGETRSGTVAGLRSPELASDTSSSPGRISWWWWLVLALIIGAGLGTWLWARHRNGSVPDDPAIADRMTADPPDDSEPDDWLESSFIDDVPSITR